MTTNNAWNSQDPAQVAKGGTGIATTTAYAPICGGTSATGALQAASTGLGTSGYVLTSNGSSALPSFQAAGGGGGDFILLQSISPAGATTVVFNSTYITSSYKSYVITISDLVSSSESGGIFLFISDDNGSTYKTSGYQYGVIIIPNTGTTLFNVTGSNILLNMGDAGNGLSGSVNLYNLTSGSGNVVALGNLFYLNGNQMLFGSGSYPNLAVNNIKITSDNGGTLNGIISLYGLKQ